MKRAFLFHSLFVLAAQSALGASLSVAVTDGDGKPLEDAVVSVVVAGAAKRAASGTVAEVTQQERRFVPRVSVVQTGTAVSFPNLDSVRHHVYSFSPIKPFELKLYAGTPSAPVVFDKAGVAVLGCNIHDRMSAWVVVVDTPYFAKTDATGRAHVEVPEGEHLLKVLHPAQPEGSAAFEKRVRAGSAVAVQLATVHHGA